MSCSDILHRLFSAKKKVETIEELAYLMRVMNYIVSFYMKNWKHRQKISFCYARMNSEKTDLASIYCLAWN